MTNAATRTASYDEIIADPAFKRGYHEIFDGRECCVDVRWGDEEALAYERGRHFGIWVKHQEGQKVPLVRGYLAHPRAKLLLLLAMRDGDVR